MPAHIGAYRVDREIGRGGMGVVYLARDTKLDRDVAIKALPKELAESADRMARFEREAKTLARLSHTNIAGIYGVEEQNGQRYLILEYVEGETLAKQLERGPRPIDETLKILVQIAAGVEAAHDAGVIHRDLKPGNVIVTPGGTVKVVDFGLARTEEAVSSDHLDHDTPTLSSPAHLHSPTMAGAILGTAAYMSPEQARGRQIDKRSDIWSFGVILYECLTSSMLFGGETATDSMGAIMHREPEWSALPGPTPAAIRRLLRRCLAKDRQERLRDIGDARLEIEDALRLPETDAATSPRRPRIMRTLPWGLAALMAIVATLAILKSWAPLVPGDRPPPRPRHLHLYAPNAHFPLLSKPFAVARDGSIAWVQDAGEGAHIVIDRLNGSPPRIIPGSEGATQLFFSPDGERLGFFAANAGESFSSLYELKTVGIDGGRPVTLCESTLPGSASWTRDGRIYFSDRLSSVLAWVPESGGEVRRRKPDITSVIQNPFHVEALPDGRGLLVTSRTGLFAIPNSFDAPIHSITTGRSQGAIGSMWDVGRARYLPTGHIAFAQRGRLMAAPFDLETLTLLAPPTPVLDGVRSSLIQETWDCSEDGTLVYVQGSPQFFGELVWADDEGVETPLPFDPAYYGTFRLSPDGQRIVTAILDVKWDVWVLDLVRGTRYRLTTEGENRWPIWSVDGDRIYFMSNRQGEFELYSMRSDGVGEAELLTAEFASMPRSISPDGRYLALDQGPPNGLYGILLLSLDANHETMTFGQASAANQWDAMFSPDGRHIAYTCDESGEWYVYVEPCPADGRRWRISTTRFGEEPVWSSDGKTLYYRIFEQWMAVDLEVDEDGTLNIGSQRVVLEGEYINAWGISYDVASDGRLLVERSVDQDLQDHVRVITNWFEELRAKVPPAAPRPGDAGRPG